MKSREQRRRRLIKLHRLDCRCFWCKRPTVLVISDRSTVNFPRRATIDHLDHKLSGRRRPGPREPRTVLACFECNQRRGAEDLATLRSQT